jgi:leucyl aminopeptidase
VVATESLWTLSAFSNHCCVFPSSFPVPSQCLPKTEADHIYAAALLRRSVKPTVPWLHVDLASAHRVGGLGHVGTDFTGAGVRFAVHMIHRMLE